MKIINKISSSIGAFLKKRWYVFLILLILGGYLYLNQKTAAAKQAARKVYVVKKQTLRDVLAFAGKVEASEKATLRFQSPGRLVWVGVKLGESVKKYQGVASLDQRQLEQNLKKNLNYYMKTRWTFDQTKQDNKEADVRSGDLGDKMKRLIDLSQFDLNNSVIDVELQTLAKEYSVLSSPINGVVTRIDTPNPGVNITLSDTVEIINPSTYYFSANADQTEVVSISEGMQGEITFDAFPDNPVKGSVESISYTPKVDETGTVYEVKVQLPEAMSVLRLGMTGDIQFVLKEKPDVLVVPIQYIKVENGNRYVLKKEGKTEVKAPVETGQENDGIVEITSGLYVGDTIYESAN